MTQHSDPTLDDVLPATEPAPEDHREHAKAPRRIDDEILDAKVERERTEVAEDAHDESS